jgi:predicted GIY-YIG superfamily endonuclease
MLETLKQKAKAAAPQRSEGGPSKMQFFYTYILQSISDPAHFYVGSTEDLRARLKKHNAGEVSHSAKYRPCQIKTAIAFTALERARQFERYLKTASGRAFAKKRL